MKKTLLLFATMLAMFTSYAQTTLTLVPANATQDDATLGIGQVGSAVALTTTYTGSGKVTYTLSSGAGTLASDGSTFTPTEVGFSTIKATDGTLTATAKVYAYDTNLATNNLYASSDGSNGSAAYALNGNESDRWVSTIQPKDLSTTNPAYLVVDMGALYDVNAIYLSFETANAADFTLQFSTNGTDYSVGKTVQNLASVAGGAQYRYLYTDLTNNTQVRYVKFNGTRAATDWAVSIWEMGVYGSNRNPDPNALSVTVANGVATVKGDICATNVKDINNADAMFIDLTNVTSVATSGLTSTSIQPKHVNALIEVKGTYDGGSPAVPASMYEPIKDTKNMVVRQEGGYLHPVNKLQFVDSDPTTQPMYNCEGTTVSFISTGTPGYKITRSFKPNCFSTVYLPVAISSLPTGITVWEASDYSSNAITFKQSNAIQANYPYVVCNSNSVATDISWEGSGDVALANTSTINPVTIGSSSVKIQGCMSYITTASGDNPAKYVLQNSTYDGTNGTVKILKGEGVTITPFRAYFTGLNVGAANAYFPIVSGINSMKVNADNNNRVAYTLSGQRVNAENLNAGLYIINGKKLIIK